MHLKYPRRLWLSITLPWLEKITQPPICTPSNLLHVLHGPATHFVFSPSTNLSKNVHTENLIKIF